jgi:(S)-2-hydroxyglutarate dehydrogenase
MTHYDYLIVGGGIVGIATAMALTKKAQGSLAVIEAEQTLAQHQTGHNSGVIHSGLYYKPGSLKARNCAQGRQMLYQFCAEHGIPHTQCGKIVVAICEEEIPRLDELHRRGTANGLEGLLRLTSEEMRRYEPHVNGVSGLWVPQTGIVNFTTVTEAYAREVTGCGGTILTSCRMTGMKQSNGEMVIETSCGEIHARFLVNCAGLHSDQIACACGLEPGLRIVPFRGEYYKLAEQRRHLVRNLIYPVPNPEFPFLGVHFTRHIDGIIEAGPNAVFALAREGYGKFDISMKDTMECLMYPGFWRMACKYWKTGLGECYRSLSKRAFVSALRRLIPEATGSDFSPGGAGVRAQALGDDGALIDDFRIVQGERMIHVLNAPSPAATASLYIGQSIADLVLKQS